MDALRVFARQPLGVSCLQHDELLEQARVFLLLMTLLLCCWGAIGCVAQDNGATPLINAAGKGYNKIVGTLLAAGADVNQARVVSVRALPGGWCLGE